ncbi:histidine phosphotransferase family protein [Rubellimicrobium aerolatum]|uniref:Histidine phosphotransferase family protein n=1 Tax=Rubellimicrobium aerolatum TaxID=490979 RepID=A0ABW0S855_9RHOB|nr:histidine phosphotransferase ChpT [Rubellimicrobium aerolatum]
MRPTRGEVHSPFDGVEPDGEAGLAATLASRICHDLASPLGAIANGLELLALAGVEPSPELDLLSQSVESGSARLRFFRIAYGAAGTRSVGRSEVARTLASLSKGSRIALEWEVAGDHPRQEVKAVFLLIQCLEAALPSGGCICVSRSADGWTLTAEGSRIRFDASIWDTLGPCRADPPSGSAQVQFGLLAHALTKLGRRLDVALSEGRILARF